MTRCEVCGRTWAPVQGEPFWPKCPACRMPYGKPLSRRVGGICPNCGKSHKGECTEGLQDMRQSGGRPSGEV